MQTVIQEILKKYRFDLPAGIEHNPADFSKVIGAIQEALTQKRSKFKKLVSDLPSSIHSTLTVYIQSRSSTASSRTTTRVSRMPPRRTSSTSSSLQQRLWTGPVVLSVYLFVLVLL
jgi:hypothetical protein